MTPGKGAIGKSTQLRLALMASFCVLLAGCETMDDQASLGAKPQIKTSGPPRLAAPGTAVAQVQLPEGPADRLYPVTVALEPPVDPVLAAEAAEPAQLPGAVPVPRPSPMTALAMAAPVAAQGVQTAAAMPGENQTLAQAATEIASTPMALANGAAAKGGRVEMQAVQVASTAPVSVMMAEPAIARPAVPVPRPSVLGYAAPGSSNSALAAINGAASPLASTAATRMGADVADRDDINGFISRYSAEYGVPEKLVHRVVHRESRYDPQAYNRRGYFGLMQISYATARSMGYQGPANGLLDAETNLKYAVKYLRGAYLVADTNHDQAVRLYARGYYFDAKRKGMLHVLK